MFVVWSGFDALTVLVAVIGAVVGQVALEPMLGGVGAVPDGGAGGGVGRGRDRQLVRRRAP